METSGWRVEVLIPQSNKVVQVHFQCCKNDYMRRTDLQPGWWKEELSFYFLGSIHLLVKTCSSRNWKFVGKVKDAYCHRSFWSSWDFWRLGPHCMAAGFLWEKSSPKTAEEESSLLLQQNLLLKSIICGFIRIITELYNCNGHIFTGLLVRFLLQEWGCSISSLVFNSTSLSGCCHFGTFLVSLAMLLNFGVNLLRL